MVLELQVQAAVGDPAKKKLNKMFNLTDDVKRIQAMLNAAHGKQVIRVDGQPTPALTKAITDFQRLWLTPSADGVISAKNSTTLERLNAILSPLELKSISWRILATKRGPTGTAEKWWWGGVEKGVFQIKWKGDLPPSPYKVYLGLETTVNAAELVRFSYKKNQNWIQSTTRLAVKDTDAFVKLLKGKWGTKVGFRLYVMRDGNVITRSAPTFIKAPVQPWSGELKPKKVGDGDDGPKLNYINPVGNEWMGKIFHPEKIGGAYFFKRAGKVPTDNDDRGFDCITFVGSLLLRESIDGPDNPYKDSPSMADAVDAQYVGWESADGNNKIVDGKAKGKHVKKYFELATSTGSFLLWKGSHIVIVHDKTTYEFSQGKGGFKESTPAAFMADETSYTVAKLPVPF